MSMRKPLLLALLLGLLISLAGGPATLLAGEGPAVEPRAEQLLKDTLDYLKSAKEFSFKAEVTYDDVLSNDQKIEYSSTFEAFVKRNNKVRTNTRGDLSNRSFYYDGKTATLYNHEEKFYASAKAPSNTDKMLDFMNEKLGFVPPIADLLRSDVWGLIKDNMKGGFYAGLHQVNGVPCHHLVFSGELLDFQIWIKEGPGLVIKKIVFTYREVPEAPQFTAYFTDWDFSPYLSDRIFSFDPPAGARRIDFAPADD